MSFFADFGGLAIGFLGAGLAACLCGAGTIIPKTTTNAAKVT